MRSTTSTPALTCSTGDSITRARPKASFGGVRAGDLGLGRGEPGDGHPEGRAAHVVEADFVEKFDRRGIATVLAADADFQIRPAAPAFLDGHLDQPTYADPIDGLERVLGQDLLLEVAAEELPFRVVA